MSKTALIFTPLTGVVEEASLGAEAWHTGCRGANRDCRSRSSLTSWPKDIMNLFPITSIYYLRCQMFVYRGLRLNRVKLSLNTW